MNGTLVSSFLFIFFPFLCGNLSLKQATPGIAELPSCTTPFHGGGTRKWFDGTSDNKQLKIYKNDNLLKVVWCTLCASSPGGGAAHNNCYSSKTGARTSTGPSTNGYVRNEYWLKRVVYICVWVGVPVLVVQQNIPPSSVALPTVESVLPCVYFILCLAMQMQCDSFVLLVFT